MPHTDICIAGAGVIGSSLALELHRRGLSVTLLDAGQPLREASWAAAGMLAAHDPHNPVELGLISELSISLYPAFLAKLESLGELQVPLQTRHTLQSTHVVGAGTVSFEANLSATDLADPLLSCPGFQKLNEDSIDPRQLAASMQAAVATTSIRVLSGEAVTSTKSASGTVWIRTQTATVEAKEFIDCTGAWARSFAARVVPIKGQMLAVTLPTSFPLDIAVRTADIYILPRTSGPMAGRGIIGATVEDVGFDKTVHAAQIEDLRQRAATLLPQLAHAEVVDTWSGLRPATLDFLPVIGPHPTLENHWVASGHFRNGILLAPATAHVLTQLVLGEVPSVPLAVFSPSRKSLQTRAVL